jgi:hypothetical protein
MNKDNQKEFVCSLTKTILTDINESIESDSIPENWDGHELRRYLAYKFKSAVIGDMSKNRIKGFNNTILINNL